MSIAGDAILARCKPRLETLLMKAGIRDHLRITLVAKKLKDADMETEAGGAGSESRTHFRIAVDPFRCAKHSDADIDELLGHEITHCLLWEVSHKAIDALKRYVPDARFKEVQQDISAAEEAFCYRLQSVWRALLGHPDPIIETTEE
jgi:hypothetical protein